MEALLATVIMACGADQFRPKAERASDSTSDISLLSWAPVVTPGRGLTCHASCDR